MSEKVQEKIISGPGSLNICDGGIFCTRISTYNYISFRLIQNKCTFNVLIDNMVIKVPWIASHAICSFNIQV
jgi:hypothetical protein